MLGNQVMAPDLLALRELGAPSPYYSPLVRPHLPFGVRIPDSFDPGAVQRSEVFLMAVRRRASAIPSLAASPLAHAEEAEAMEGPSVAGPCYTEERPRATFGGGNARHDEFAELVTHGNLNELLVRAPEGVECQFDGEDLQLPGLVWEVKTFHDFASDLGLAARGMNPTVLQMIDRLEWQRLKCLFVATRCGYRYQYAVDNCVVARAMRQQWANIPPVFFRQAPWSEPCP